MTLFCNRDPEESSHKVWHCWLSSQSSVSIRRRTRHRGKLHDGFSKYEEKRPNRYKEHLFGSGKPESTTPQWIPIYLFQFCVQFPPVIIRGKSECVNRLGYKYCRLSCLSVTRITTVCACVINSPCHIPGRLDHGGSRFCEAQRNVTWS